MFRLSHQTVSAAAALALLLAPAALAQEAQDNSDEVGAAEVGTAEADATEGEDYAESIGVCARWSGEDEEWVMSNAGETGCEIVVVSATRLLHDPTARVQVITAEEIAARGLATTEDILRAIPQNFASINTYNNRFGFFSVMDPGITGEFTGGLATANLRGLGSRNTLVLVNGRRVASTAGILDFIANVRNIPAAAIDRVEVMLDGGGAVYGSDAVGGVVNIILKEDYAGASLAGRYEQSATGGNQNRLDATLGYSWGGGNVTAVVSRTERDPVNNHKAGFTTWDYRPRFGPSEDYNFVGENRVRSALVATSRWAPFLILPPGNDGRNVGPGDFVATTPADFLDVVFPHAGGSSEDLSATLAVNHTFFDKLDLSGEVLWQESVTRTSAISARQLTVIVPESNAFNNFGQDMFVKYYAQREIDDGLIKPGESVNERENGRVVVGLDYSWTDRRRFVLEHTYGVSDSVAQVWRFTGLGTLYASETENERLRALLASSDPNVAPNFFGDGSGQNDSFAEFYMLDQQSLDRAYVRLTTGYFRGDILDAPGGRIEFAAGGEVRSEWTRHLSSDRDVRTGVGVREPTRDLRAAFLELQVPLFGDRNARRGVQELVVTAKARYDEYETEGAVGEGANGPNVVDVTFDNVATYFGIAYKPMADLTVRASHSDGFVPPKFRDLFSRPTRDQAFYAFDPLKGTYVPTRVISRSNENLQPEVSTTLNVGFDWTPSQFEDFGVELYFSDVDIRNRIGGNTELVLLLSPEVYGNLPQFFVRAEDGTLQTAISTYVNIARRVSQALDLTVYKTFPSTLGEFLVEMRYNRVLNQFDQPFENSERVSFVGKSTGVDRYRASLAVRWRRDATTINAFLNYTPGYVNNDHERQTASGRDIPLMDVSSWTTLDASVTHRFENGLRLQAGARDLLGREFPFMLTRTGRPHDARRVDLRGRVFYFSLTYDFGFGK